MKSLVLLLLLLPTVFAAESVCYGTVSNGRIKDAIELPSSGDNFESYGTTAELLGRNFVHSKVHDVLLTAFAALEKSHPEWQFKYGETGAREGGKFKPHRTHQNGLSIDMMMPVRTRDTNKPTMIATHVMNKWGYDVDFDKKGVNADYAIDFAVLAAELKAIYLAAKKHGVGISRTIVTLDFHEVLGKTPDGVFVKKHLALMQKEAWVRHDEHFHIDFDYPCKKM